ncbi:amino acid adenylation domain-containing protein [Streptomyces sp. NPDC020883]|uniref:amino acid adenylation domain-containing protein n=1 Tax=Streptomyces sp. NPDC020883 TaxID=3365099 RepID=UPI00379C95FB
MNAAELLMAELEELGVQLWEEGGALRYRAPEGVLTHELKEQLRRCKPEVLERLRRIAEEQRVEPDAAGRYAPFPLTDMQSAYLLGRRDVFAYGGVSCHGYGELEFDTLDPVRLEIAWQKMIERHDMLRATVDGDGTQQVAETTPAYRLHVEDLPANDLGQRAARTDEIREEMGHRVYDSSVWPLFELRVTRSSEKAVLHFSIDFLIADFLSIQLLLDELRQLYECPDTELPALTVQFRDYLRAERALRSGPRHERDRAYWWERIDELPAAPELPVESAADAPERPHFRRYALDLTPQQWSALRERAGRYGITPSTAVLAAYTDVIGTWSRNPRFTLNLTLLNRLPLHPDATRLIGDFTSVNLLEVAQNHQVTLAERASALQGRLWEDLDHRLCSGVEVMREMSRRRGPDAALMPVVFTSAIGVGGTDDGLGEEAWGRLGHGISQTPQVWIDCQNIERRGGLATNWDVREGVVPAPVLDAMFDAYRTLLLRLAEDDEAWQEQAPVRLPAAQRDRRRAVNETSGPLPDALLHEGFVRQARLTPDRPAVISDRRTLTYGELLAHATAVADAVRAHSRIGELVAVVMDKGWEQTAAVLGILLAGRAYLPIDSLQPALRRDHILKDAAVRCALTQSWLSPRTAAPDGHDVTWIATDTLTPVTTAPPQPQSAPDDLAYVIYTSGSTGRPKGVMVSHRSALNTIEDINRRFDVTKDDRVLGLANLGFDLSVYDVFGPLSVGGALVLPAHEGRSDPSHWARTAAEHRVTVWNSVPAQMQMLGHYLDAERDRGPAQALALLRLALLSGDWIPVALPGHLAGLLPDLRLVSLGGATEAAIWSIHYPIGEVPQSLSSIPYGTPLTNQTFAVLDQDLRDRPELVAGELYIGGAGLALGYLGDEELSAAKFLRHPVTGERLYRTGDLGRYLPDGTIEFLGREDSQVKIRGHRIELAEVEAGLLADPSVGAAVALVTGESATDRKLCAFVTGKSLETPPEPAEDVLSALTEAATAVRDALDGEIDEIAIAAFVRDLDTALLTSMAQTLGETGLFADGGAPTAEDLATALGTLPEHRSLVRRWLRELEGAAMVRRSDDGRHRDLRPANVEDRTRAWERAEAARTEQICPAPLMAYFRSSAESLRALLRGELNPSRMFFPEGSQDVAEATYSQNVAAEHNNRIAAEALRCIAAARSASDGPLRVLEVGGGIASTTRHAVAALAPYDIHYTFTDVSQYFLQGARTRFGDRTDMAFQLYDLNEDPRPQGLTANSYDVVLCGGVLNNARHTGRTLRRLKELLVPGGWLVFIEATREHLEISVSQAFMMEEFDDFRAEEGTTFVHRGQWLDLMTELGADSVICLPQEDDGLSAMGQHVFAVRLRPERTPVRTPELTERLRRRLPEHMLPTEIEVLDALPLTDNGKVDRTTLRERIRIVAQPEQATAYEEVTDPLEETLAAIAAEVLGAAAVGRRQNFFDLGGDSLLVAQFVGRIREQVPECAELYFDGLLRRLLNQPTIAELADYIRQYQPAEQTMASAPALSPLIPLDDGDGPLRVLVHEGIGTMAPYRKLARELSGHGPLAGLAVNDMRGYLGLDAGRLISRLADDYAGELLAQGHRQFHIVGYCLGGLLATEMAGRLTEAGAEVASLTVVSSYRVPYRIEDELLFEYAFGRVLSADLARMGYHKDEELMGRALRAVLAATPGIVPARAFDALDADEGLAAVAARFRALRGRDHQERLDTLSAQLLEQGSPVGSTQQVTELYDVFRQSFAAATLHQPDLYAGDITFLNPQGTLQFLPGLQEDMTAYWRDACLGDLTVTEVPGDHFSCLEAPHVGTTAKEILAAAQRSGAAG